ncbi:MAG: OB-fold nucleic acid binding domain-containing protein, partial [Candidatus Bathyarchaeia archaeon]
MPFKGYYYISEVFDEGPRDEPVRIRGWLHGKRSSGGVHFLLLRDGTGIIQCTVHKGDLPEDEFKSIEKVPLESVLSVSGNVREDPRAPGGLELSLREVSIIRMAEEGYPIA